ncbi:hypothetical protein SDC9_32930 [bioreactor metagenome]|uniref:Uncharacterized protein n=1 Tax=bioreactor metagenome TaxID=1076179 RepID=A0A644V816_9ZZZZ|nr:hypothetical protein [Lentimicrobium sp.]MEA5110832.1 hypothetical protein [Lentimicrobium sp.]
MIHYQNFAQGVAVNTDNSAPDSSANLDVKSATGGLPVPGMSEAQPNAIVTPAAGLVVFLTNRTPCNFFQLWNLWFSGGLKFMW